MQRHFYKYQGTGNDFIIFDNRQGQHRFSPDQVAFLCHRRFGIGADGLMLLNSHPSFDFEMKYFNADGGESSMCGNGGRCLVSFAAAMGIRKEKYHFLAVDGEHEAFIESDGQVALKMMDVSGVQHHNNAFVLDTGSPHYVAAVEEVMNLDVVEQGRAIRNSEAFKAKGINVNFLQRGNAPDSIIVRTYERGVEDETFSCGTGVTAAALVSGAEHDGDYTVQVQTKGGRLSVRYQKRGGQYSNIWLIGPAVKVFEGVISLSSET